MGGGTGTGVGAGFWARVKNPLPITMVPNISFARLFIITASGNQNGLRSLDDIRLQGSGHSATAILALVLRISPTGNGVLGLNRNDFTGYTDMAVEPGRPHFKMF
jgi:hypothetical protein